ncbi:creatininase family protein [Acidobacteriota bacterium]
MIIRTDSKIKKAFLILGLLLAFMCFVQGKEEAKPLILQEISWTDVVEYLKTNDMVIIPLGSTEQHGPHLPLGTDFYEATGVAKIISARTGVLLAPVLFSGYSVYHSGFPGTLSLKPETMEEVLFETAELLMKYGFRKFMFFNYHGGNRIVESKVIHRINHTTEAVAVAIGYGASFQKAEPIQGADYDAHAGIGETSLMLYFRPDLVKLERAKRPKITYTPQAKELIKLSQEHPELGDVLKALQFVPEETKKDGASHQISSNGIFSSESPKGATKEQGEKQAFRMADRAVKFIEAWKKTKK